MKVEIKHILVIVLLLIMDSCVLTNKRNQLNETTKRNQPLEKIENYLKSIIKTDNEAGFSITIVKEKKIIFCNSYGVKNIENKIKLEPYHIFHIASISKTFVATAVMQLVEQGKIDINKPFAHYVPEFKLSDEHYIKITIKQILNHTSGLPDTEEYEWEKAVNDDAAAMRYLKSIENEKLISEPGSKFNYSNIGYDILACLITNVSKQSFEDYIETNILRKLKMFESSFYFPNIKDSLRVSPHISNKGSLQVSNIYPYNRMHSPSSTLNISVTELANWAIVNLNEGVFENQKIFSKKTYSDLTTKTAKTDFENEFIGLAWFLYVYKNTIQIEHSGSDLGFGSILTLLPFYKTGIIILSNNEDFDIKTIRNTVRDILLDSSL
jgi:CubicO group peptidase (beta-lactamase class C family)